MSFDKEDLYHALLKKGLSSEDIDLKLKEIISKLGGYITNEAAQLLLVKEYDIKVFSPDNNCEINNEFEDTIDYDEFLVKINDVQPGTNNIVLLGKVVKNYGVKTFAKKDGTSGKVGSFLIQDDSGTIKIVLWEDQSDIVQSEAFQENILVRVIGGYSKVNINGKTEVHLSRKSKIEFILEEHSQESISGTKIKEALTMKDALIKTIVGKVSEIVEFREIDLKNGNKTFLFKFLLSEDDYSINVLVWDLNAIYCFKSVKKGDFLKLNDVFLKFNTFSNQKELIFTKKSKVLKIS